MASVLNYNPEYIFTFFILLIRVGGVFLTAPIISSETVPRMIRVYLAFLMTLILFNVIPPINYPTNLNVAFYFLIVAKELMVGLLLGVVPRVMFAAIDFAGTVIGFQMGFSMANVVDPQTSATVSIIASFKTLIATLLFVTVDGHHIFIEALAASYQKIPIGGFLFNEGKVQILIELTATIFSIGLQLGAPIIVALLFTNVMMGFTARSIPNLNVFVVGFPLTILLGMVFLVTGMPFLTQSISQQFLSTRQGVIDLLSVMAK